MTRRYTFAACLLAAAIETDADQQTYYREMRAEDDCFDGSDRLAARVGVRG